jgi:hypothetical protein
VNRLAVSLESKVAGREFALVIGCFRRQIRPMGEIDRGTDFHFRRG